MRSQASVARLIDANLNRALEGARVCEDIARFHLRAITVFRRLRRLRHDIAEAANELPLRPRELLAQRASRRDPGRNVPASRIDSLERLLLINCQRVKEALRTLEECARLGAPRSVSRFQALRFRTYDIERDLVLNLASLRHH